MGQRYGTEIAQVLVEYGFSQLPLDRIMATTELDNDASVRVMEKAVLRFEKGDEYYNWPRNYFAINKNKEE